MTRLTPSYIRRNPGAYPPDQPCIIRAPLGEFIGPMAFPMVILKLQDKLDHSRITDSDHWNAQGLEGAGEMKCNWSQAFVLTHKAADDRCTILIPRPDFESIRILALQVWAETTDACAAAYCRAVAAREAAARADAIAEAWTEARTLASATAEAVTTARRTARSETPTPTAS